MDLRCLGARKLLCRVQRQEARHLHGLQEHVVLREAHHEQPRQRLEQPGLAELRPGHLATREPSAELFFKGLSIDFPGFSMTFHDFSMFFKGFLLILK